MALLLERTLERTLAELASAAQGFLDGAGVGELASFKVQLALEETIRNLIEHAHGFLTPHVQVRIEVDRGRITLDLEDDGQPFDPASAPAYDPALPLEARESHGMGVYLLRRLMEEIQYERRGRTNRLRLVIGASPAPAGGPGAGPTA